PLGQGMQESTVSGFLSCPRSHESLALRGRSKLWFLRSGADGIPRRAVSLTGASALELCALSFNSGRACGSGFFYASKEGLETIMSSMGARAGEPAVRTPRAGSRPHRTIQVTRKYAIVAGFLGSWCL